MGANGGGGGFGSGREQRESPARGPDEYRADWTLLSAHCQHHPYASSAEGKRRTVPQISPGAHTLFAIEAKSLLRRSKDVLERARVCVCVSRGGGE